MKKVILSLACISIALFVSLRIYSVNKQFQREDSIVYQLGDILTLGEIELRITECHFMDLDEQTEYKQYIGDDSEAVECLVLDYYIKNTSEEPVHFENSFLSLGSGAWRQQIHYELFLALNSGASLFDSILDPGEEINLKLPFLLMNYQFTSKDWDNIYDRQFILYITLFPIKQVILL